MAQLLYPVGAGRGSVEDDEVYKGLRFRIAGAGTFGIRSSGIIRGDVGAVEFPLPPPHCPGTNAFTAGTTVLQRATRVTSSGHHSI
jgi:hypothetical protein